MQRPAPLDCPRGPVSPDCGHSYHSCLPQRWEELWDICPGLSAAATTTAQGDFRRNAQAGHMADSVQRLSITRSHQKWQEETRCVFRPCSERGTWSSPVPSAGCLLGQPGSARCPLSRCRRKHPGDAGPLRAQAEDAETGYENQVLKTFQVRRRMESRKTDYTMNVETMDAP